MEIPESEFKALLDDLTKHPLQNNRYRTTAGAGRSQCFGIVNKRCQPPDYSRHCWLRPYTYKLLMDFAEKWVDLSWNAVTVNDNYQAAPHRDKGNVGVSYLVGFGTYYGGQLELHEGDRKGLYDIRHRPLIHDFSKDLHSVTDWVGNRFSLVFYWCDLRGTEVPPPTVRLANDTWYFYRGNVLVTKDCPLYHPKLGVPRG